MSTEGGNIFGCLPTFRSSLRHQVDDADVKDPRQQNFMIRCVGHLAEMSLYPENVLRTDDLLDLRVDGTII